MRILYLHQYFSTRDGATGTRSYEMAKRLVASGHEVTVVCASAQVSNSGLQGPFRFGRREGQVDGIHVVEFNLGYSNYLGLLRRASLFCLFVIRTMGICLLSRYDLLFATSTPLTVAIPGIVMKRFRRRPFVFEVRDLWPEIPVAMGGVTNPLIIRLLDILERAAYASADACIGLAPGICAGIRDKIHGAKAIAMIPNGSDLELFRPGSDRACLPGEVAKYKLVAVFSGAHGKANNLNAILDAAAILKERSIEDIGFLFIGDGKEKPMLCERARRERLDCCVFLAPIPKTRLCEILPNCDVGLQVLGNFPAFYRGTSPNKFFDYLSAGIPVLINYPGWLAETVSSHGNGVAVEPENPEAFADALIKLRDNPDARRAMGQASRELARKEFDRDNLGKAFVEFLEESAREYYGR